MTMIKISYRFVMAGLLLAFGGHYALAQNSLRQPRREEIPLGPFPQVHEISGIKVSTPVLVFFQLTPDVGGMKLQARLLADLADLQRQIGALIDTIPLPTNECDHFGLDNLVARIWGKEMTITNDTAMLELKGDVEVWSCVKAPPCTKIENWQLVIYDCNPPFKDKVTQPFTATLPARLVAADRQTLTIQLGQPAVNLGGPLGGVTGTLLKIAGIEINHWIQQLLDVTVDPRSLRLVLKNDQVPLDPVITRAGLLSADGRLAASVELEAPLDATSLAKLLEILVNPDWQPQ